MWKQLTENGEIFSIHIGILIWNIILILSIIFGLLWVHQITSVEKPVKRYYLSGGEMGGWKIRLDIENGSDDWLLINGMDYQVAAEYVSKLNEELIKHPRLK